ncbi:ArsR/SmtB family transcription factor [Paenibacillus sp. 1P03SA]|uniref:ArsR/SmtB family transcription factor n=1 Tax=Paenibacillus sp. 1P03SA TaxID=3132294 RepID=UPI0039A129FE
MNASPDTITLAGLIGEPSRMQMLLELLSGKCMPASELAGAARITPQTASSHLAKLVEGGLLTVELSGRHRYYKLAGPEVADALEALNALALPKPVKSLREHDRLNHLRFARTCYDHLAGEAGVALADRLLESGIIGQSGRDFTVTEKGEIFLRAFDIDCAELRRSRRQFAKCCLDWSERRYHIAGSLGAALTEQLFRREWIERIPGGRAVRITESGRDGLRHLGVNLNLR